MVSSDSHIFEYRADIGLSLSVYIQLIRLLFASISLIILYTKFGEKANFVTEKNFDEGKVGYVKEGTKGFKNLLRGTKIPGTPVLCKLHNYFPKTMPPIVHIAQTATGRSLRPERPA